MIGYFIPFAGAGLEMAALPELRAELIREARFLLEEWERFGSEETCGRLLQVLEDLALVVRAGRG